MINYNIMNIILYKISFKEWKDRVKDIHKELNEEYIIDTNKYNGLEPFGKNFIGDFMYIRTKCSYCCPKCTSCFHKVFNHRHIREIKNISSKYSLICYQCRKLELSKNY